MEKNSDLKTGASVIGADGKQYTVVSVCKGIIPVQKTICTIENESGKKLSVPIEELTPFGKNAAKIALFVCGKTLITGTAATFVMNTNGQLTRVKGIIENITQDTLTIDTANGAKNISIGDITGVSLVI